MHKRPIKIVRSVGFLLSTKSWNCRKFSLCLSSLNHLIHHLTECILETKFEKRPQTKCKDIKNTRALKPNWFKFYDLLQALNKE